MEESMKNQEELVSVIVPVFNVEKYLDECVTSIVNQTYMKLEIILVDDGSTDSCSWICDNWALKDNRIKVIHKENGGLSDARNVGIDKSTGEYVVFVDSDDVIAPFYVENLHNVCVANGVQLAICRHIKFSDNKKPVFDMGNGNVQLLDSKEAISLFFGIFFTEIVAACTKMYHHNLVRRIKFPYGKINEDVENFWKYIEASGTIAFSESIAYGYRMRDGSITKAKYTIRNLDLVEFTRKSMQHYKGKDAELYKQFLFFHILTLFRSVMFVKYCLNSVDKDNIYYSLKYETYKCIREYNSSWEMALKYTYGLKVFLKFPFLYWIYFVLRNGKVLM